jgi:hypothetical protein
MTLSPERVAMKDCPKRVKLAVVELNDESVAVAVMLVVVPHWPATGETIEREVPLCVTTAEPERQQHDDWEQPG